MDSDYQKLTWRQMASYHEEIRKRIFIDVEKTYASLNIKSREITYDDTIEANSWKKLWKNSRKIASWDWTELHYQYHSRGGARRFDMALTMNGNLVSLCYGMMERDRVVLKLHALEHSPSPHNTIFGHTLNINLYAAELYAALNGSNEIWLCDPVSPAHVRLYRSKGFTPHENHRGAVTHLVTRL